MPHISTAKQYCGIPFKGKGAGESTDKWDCKFLIRALRFNTLCGSTIDNNCCVTQSTHKGRCVAYQQLTTCWSRRLV